MRESICSLRRGRRKRRSRGEAPVTRPIERSGDSRGRRGRAGGDTSDRVRGDTGRDRARRADRHGVRARRAAVRDRAGRPAARDQERDAARDPLPHGQRQLVRRARPARRRVRPELRHQPLRLRLLHDGDAADPQPRQPLHRQRRRRGPGQRGRDPRAREPLRRDEPQRRRAPLRAGRQALRRRRRQRERRQLADARQPPRQDPPHQPRRRDPDDNPFYDTATGANRAIWALGLRNPFTFAFQPGTGRMFINDVGQNTWEEINDGIAGSNYGWPDTEGPTTDPRFRAPIFSYGHGTGPTTGCAITGGAFYNPARAVPERVRRRLLLRRLLQRLDPQARPGGREHGRRLRDRHREPRRPGVGERRQPLLPRPRRGRRGLPRRLHRQPGAEHHDAPVEPDGAGRRHGHLHRRGQRHAAACVPVAAERRRHRRRHVGELHASPR